MISGPGQLPPNYAVPDFTPTDYEGLVNSTLGDLGTSADGWDSSMATWVAAIAAIDMPWPDADGYLADLYNAAAIYEAITDEVSAELAAITALYDADELGLGQAIAALASLGSGPLPFSIPGMPIIGGIAEPVAVDITAMVETAVGAALVAETNWVLGYLTSLIDTLLGEST